MDGAQGASRVQRIREGAQNILRINIVVARRVLRVCAVTVGATFRSRVSQVVRQALLYARLVEGEIRGEIIDKSWPLVSTRLYELVLRGIAPINVLNLGVAECRFDVVLELLTRSCVWTQNIAPASYR